MYYFESPHAGCHDGEVEKCDVNHDNGFAVIKFSSPDGKLGFTVLVILKLSQIKYPISAGVRFLYR